MARIQKHVWLAFKVEGKKLVGANTNPVLHKFYYMLNDFRIEKGTMKIVVNYKDAAVIQQIDSTWLKGSVHLDMEVIGYREGEEGVFGLDHSTSALILNELAKLKVDEGKYTQHVKIEVLEVTFSENYRRYPNVWPSEQIPVVGF